MIQIWGSDVFFMKMAAEKREKGWEEQARTVGRGGASGFNRPPQSRVRAGVRMRVADGDGLLGSTRTGNRQHNGHGDRATAARTSGFGEGGGASGVCQSTSSNQ